jgi:hypothetical protein
VGAVGVVLAVFCLPLFIFPPILLCRQPGTFSEDLAIHYTAGMCALIQESREMDAKVPGADKV